MGDRRPWCWDGVGEEQDQRLLHPRCSLPLSTQLPPGGGGGGWGQGQGVFPFPRPAQPVPTKPGPAAPLSALTSKGCAGPALQGLPGTTGAAQLRVQRTRPGRQVWVLRTPHSAPGPSLQMKLRDSSRILSTSLSWPGRMPETAVTGVGGLMHSQGSFHGSFHAKEEPECHHPVLPAAPSHL